MKRDLSNKQFEERLKNDDLLRDLQDIDRLARKVQADKEYTVEAADRELTEAKVKRRTGGKSFPNEFLFQIEIEHNHRELQTLDAKVASLSSVGGQSLVRLGHQTLETCFQASFNRELDALEGKFHLDELRSVCIAFFLNDVI